MIFDFNAKEEGIEKKNMMKQRGLGISTKKRLAVYNVIPKTSLVETHGFNS